MPWKHCDVQILDDTPCPTCGEKKPAWTLRINSTRVFQLRRPNIFLEILLLDQDQAPIPNRKYTVVLQKEEDRTGMLDALGFACEKQIPASRCEVTFEGLPGWRLDEEAIELPSPARRKPAGRRMTFMLRPLALELDLEQLPRLDSELDMDDPPLIAAELGLDDPPRVASEVGRDEAPAPEVGLSLGEAPTLESQLVVC